MFKFFCILNLLFGSAYGSLKTYDRVSDYGMYAMIATPFAYSVIKKDSEKLLITGISTASNLAFTTIAKFVSDRERPDGSNNMSFWSGHTSASFTSAGLMCAFESKTCLPLLGVATSVGLLRVVAKKHHFTDVLVGAYVGFAGSVATYNIVIGW